MNRKLINKLQKSFLVLMSLTLLVGLTGCTNNAEGANANKQEVVLYVTRHGKTMFNTVHRAQGWSDTPLTEAGVEVAEELGKGLKSKDITFEAAYSSDSGRARETAQIVLENNGQPELPLAEDVRLREFSFGIFEGDTNENMWGAAAKELGYDSADAFMASEDSDIRKATATIKSLDTTGTAEDFDTVQKRMVAAVNDIATEVEKNGGGNVLVVAHGMSITALIADITEMPKGQLENASVTKITYKDGVFTVEEIGSMEYVELGKSA